MPINNISLLLPVFFFLRFLLYGGKWVSICRQLCLMAPRHHLTRGFINPVLSDLFQDEVRLLGLRGGDVN